MPDSKAQTAATLTVGIPHWPTHTAHVTTSDRTTSDVHFRFFTIFFYLFINYASDNRQMIIVYPMLCTAAHKIFCRVRCPMSHTFVCALALSRSRFLTDFDEIWHRHLEPDKKDPFRWGWKSTKGIPYFNPILPQIGTYIIHWNIETLLWRCLWTDYSGS